MNASKWTTQRLADLKGESRITAITAYDYTTARLVDEAGIQVVLVGDSLAMTMLGYEDTLPVTMAEMLMLTRAVSRGTRSAFVVADMPFMSYQVSEDTAVENAFRFMKDGRADAVKIEGEAMRASLVARLVENGIPVVGHVGLLPQNVKAMGGYKVQGREDASADTLVEDAKALEAAGASLIVIEGVPAEVGKRITDAVRIPTIGIGAGGDCDGQILVVHDLLGMYPDLKPRFVKRYAELGESILDALKTYRKEVEDGAFPGDEHVY